MTAAALRVPLDALTLELMDVERRAELRAALVRALESVDTEDDRDLVHALCAIDTARDYARLLVRKT